MASNRLIYDNCAFKDRLRQNNEQINYKLYTGYHYNCGSCRPKYSPGSGYGDSYVSNPEIVKYNDPTDDRWQIDVESELKNLGIKNSDCFTEKTNLLDMSKITYKHKPSCLKIYDPSFMQSTRLSYPAWDVKTWYVDRFDYLYKDPQDPSTIYWDRPLDTQLYTKDTYRTHVTIPWGSKASLPAPL